MQHELKLLHQQLDVGMEVEVMPTSRSSFKSVRNDEEDDEKVFKWKKKSGRCRVERSREYPRSHSVPVSPTRQKDTV